MNESAAARAKRETDLVRRAQAGDRAALAQVLLPYQERLYNLSLRLCGQAADAADAMQTTLLKAIEGLPRYDGRAQLFTWLYRIAINVALTQRRTAARRQVLSLGVDGDHAIGGVPEPSSGQTEGDMLERDETAAAVTAALGDLDVEFRSAVILRDMENLDYATIADLLEVPVGTVKSRIARGRLMLRKLLMKAQVRVDAE